MDYPTLFRRLRSLTYNRTMLELKSYRVRKDCEPYQPYNRTMLELKYR